MAAVAFTCMTMSSVALTSCTEEKTEIKTELVYYRYNPNGLEWATNHKDVFLAFTSDLTSLLESIRYTYVSESDLIKRIQAVVDIYNNQYIRGVLVLESSPDQTNFTTVKTFTMTAAE